MSNTVISKQICTAKLRIDKETRTFRVSKQKLNLIDSDSIGRDRVKLTKLMYWTIILCIKTWINRGKLKVVFSTECLEKGNPWGIVNLRLFRVDGY